MGSDFVAGLRRAGPAGRRSRRAERSSWNRTRSQCLTGTAQPPLPLQLFLPAHFWSPVLQPPWPLHAFLVAHSCFSDVAQPPLPLQLFLPEQPASPVLQPPWPLQAFMPLQACFSPAGTAFEPPSPLAASCLHATALPASTPPTATARNLPRFF